MPPHAGTYSGVGPLKMGDLVGLDTVLSGLKVMAAGLGGGGRYQPCPLLVQYVDAGE